jgi:hypothetical protein
MIKALLLISYTSDITPNGHTRQLKIHILFLINDLTGILLLS